MEKAELEEKITLWIRNLYKNEASLIEDKAHEQSVSAKLMHYLSDIFHEWDVDVEYHKAWWYEEGTKRWLKKDDTGISRRPDIIIHRRWKKKNLVLILVKWFNNDDLRNDPIDALSLKNEQNYDYAYTVVLHPCDWILKEA